MAAELLQVAVVALCVAFGCAVILGRVRDIIAVLLEARSPFLDAAAVALALGVPMAYLGGFILILFYCLHVTLASSADAAAPAPLSWFVVASLFLAAAPAPLSRLVVASLFLAAADGGW